MSLSALQREVDIRTRLRHDFPWILVPGGLVVAALSIKEYGFGWDARAYWEAWQGDMYSGAPNTLSAYLYSPAFAQMVWPLAHLPFPVFASLLAIVSGAAFAWLLAPLGRRRAIPLWIASSMEIASGNIFALLGVVAVVGFRHPAAWALPALTKISPALGPIWFSARREWGAAFRSIAAVLAIFAASYALAPALWHDWATFLVAHSATVDQPVGAWLVPGPIYRFPVAVALVIWAARKNMLWVVPIAMVLATPVFGVAAITICAAIPRLREQAPEVIEAVAEAPCPPPAPQSPNQAGR